VFIEGVLVADNLDIFLLAGGNSSYVVVNFPFVTDGSISIDFVSGAVGDPLINAIEVYDSGDPIPPPTVAPMTLPPNVAPVVPTSNTTFEDIVINCGGTRTKPRMGFRGIIFSIPFSPNTIFSAASNLCEGAQYLEQSGLRTWSEDTLFTGGSTYSISNVAVANTVDDTIYQSERVGEFSYSIPVPTGNYEIVIHFAELYVRFSFPDTSVEFHAHTSTEKVRTFISI
jgi:Malectin domain